MNLKAVLLSTLLLAPAPVMAQQVNQYDVCTQYREVYTPGHYDRYGNYVSGGVSTQTYNVPCKDPKPHHYNGHYNGRYNGHLKSDNSPEKSSCAAAPIGAILGGIAGYKTTPRVADRWYMIPLGILGGSAVGNALC
jgi:hypothetical protein